jgi:hypothetical protein
VPATDYRPNVFLAEQSGPDIHRFAARWVQALNGAGRSITPKEIRNSIPFFSVSEFSGRFLILFFGERTEARGEAQSSARPLFASDEPWDHARKYLG